MRMRQYDVLSLEMHVSGDGSSCLAWHHIPAETAAESVSTLNLEWLVIEQGAAGRRSRVYLSCNPYITHSLQRA